MKEETSNNISGVRTKDPTSLHTDTHALFVRWGVRTPLLTLNLYPTLWLPSSISHLPYKQSARNLSLNQKHCLHIPTQGQFVLVVDTRDFSKAWGSSLVTLSWSEMCLLQSHKHSSTFSICHFPGKRNVCEGNIAHIKILLCAKLWARCFTCIAYESSALIPTTHSCSAPETAQKNWKPYELSLGNNQQLPWGISRSIQNLQPPHLGNFQFCFLTTMWWYVSLLTFLGLNFHICKLW